jgi:hypothetical protein
MIRPRTPASRRSTIALLVACLALALTTAGTSEAAGANQQFDLEKGRQLYKDGKHAECEGYFAGALDGAAPSITEPELVSQARMIRGTCDLYLGRQGDALVQFERIVRLDAKFEPNPIDYPTGVLDEFHKTKQRVLAEPVTTPEAELKKQLEQSRADLLKMQAKYDALRTRYADETVVVRRSRLVAAIPFGVGQFQNGDDGLGVFFLTTESIALATATVSFIIHESIPSNPADPNKARSSEISARLFNWIGVGSFLALAIGGVVQAELGFVPQTIETRKRPLPKDARWMPTFGGDGKSFTLGIAGTF